MGTNYSTQIGAFLRVTLKKVDIPEERYRCASGHDHGPGYFNVEGFCSQCGTVIQRVSVTKTRYPRPYELIPEEHEERLSTYEHTGLPDNVVMFTSNQPVEADGVSTPWDLGFAPIAESDVQRCTEAFRRNYADLIAIIEPQVESTQIVFGAFFYAH